MIRQQDGSRRHEDVSNISSVVKALEEEKIFRVYSRDSKTESELKKIWEEAK